MYRNCNSCEFGHGTCKEITGLDILASRSDLTYAKKLGQVKLVQVGRKDITSLCKGVKSSCFGGTFPFGIEEWDFEAQVDFDTISKDYCRFEVAVTTDSRSDAWSQGIDEPFYNFCMINTCDNLKNSSPVFESSMINIVPVSQSFTYSLLAKDPDGDSLSYQFVVAEKAFNKSIQYPSAFNSQQPISVNCNPSCTFDPTLWPITGIGIDPYSGWLGFTPTTSGQQGILVIEVTEWRKVGSNLVKVGVTRRDMQLSVEDIGNFAPKIASSKLSYYGCAGTNFSFDFSIQDQVFNGNKDSVKLTMWSDLPNMALYRVAGSINQFDAFVTGPLTNSQARSKPYYVTVMATDNHCPFQITTFKTFEINVVPSPDADFTVKHTLCNKISCKPSKYSSGIQHGWFLYSATGLVDSRTGNSADFEVPKSGKWYVIHQTKNTVTGCITEIKDSVTVPPFSLMKMLETWPDKACRLEPVPLKATFTGGISPFNYQWNGNNGALLKTYFFQGDSVALLNVSDASGCELSYSKTIRMYQNPTVNLFDTAMCMPSAPVQLPVSRRYHIDPAPVGNIVVSYKGSSGLLAPKGADYTFTPTESANNRLYFQFTDTNFCHHKDSFQINVIQVQPTGIHTPAAVCSNASQLVLDKMTGCVLRNGKWSSGKKGLIAGDTAFVAAAAGSGLWPLYYAVNLQGCMVFDTSEITVHAAPDVSITKPASLVFCENSAEFVSAGVPGGGSWKNTTTPQLKNSIVPSVIIGTGQQGTSIYYTYTDKVNNCTAADSMTIMVNPAVKLNVPSGNSICEGEKLMISPKLMHAQKALLTGEYSFVTVSRNGENLLFECGNIEAPQTAKYQYSVQALPGCRDTSVTLILTLKPKPDLNLQATPAAGCTPLYTVLSATDLNPLAKASSMEWRENGGNWSPVSAITPLTLSDSGTHYYEVRGLLNGCTGNTSKVQVNAWPVPVAAADFDPPTRLVTQDYTALEASDITKFNGPLTRTWTFEKCQPAISTAQKVMVNFPHDTGVYLVKLRLVTDKGCESSFTTGVRVRPGLQLFAPNAFTPNGKGPGQNETWHVVMDSTANFHLTVRNRWGEILFRTDNQFEEWDGSSNGHDVPNGVYVWVLEANTIYGRYVQKTGVVSLIR